MLATGYAHSIPACINPIHDRIAWNEDGSYRIGRNYAIDHDGGEIYVQNTGLLSHGVTNPDLGFCCHRNSLILRELTGVGTTRSRPTRAAGVPPARQRRAGASPGPRAGKRPMPPRPS